MHNFFTVCVYGSKKIEEQEKEHERVLLINFPIKDKVLVKEERMKIGDKRLESVAQ